MHTLEICWEHICLAEAVACSDILFWTLCIIFLTYFQHRPVPLTVQTRGIFDSEQPRQKVVLFWTVFFYHYFDHFHLIAVLVILRAVILLPCVWLQFISSLCTLRVVQMAKQPLLTVKVGLRTTLVVWISGSKHATITSGSDLKQTKPTAFSYLLIQTKEITSFWRWFVAVCFLISTSVSYR